MLHYEAVAIRTSLLLFGWKTTAYDKQHANERTHLWPAENMELNKFACDINNIYVEVAAINYAVTQLRLDDGDVDN